MKILYQNLNLKEDWKFEEEFKAPFLQIKSIQVVKKTDKHALVLKVTFQAHVKPEGLNLFN